MLNLPVVAEAKTTPGRLVDFVHMTESDRRVQPEQPIWNTSWRDSRARQSTNPARLAGYAVEPGAQHGA
jgi:hypothetical protein